MIRIEIVANTQLNAERLADALADDDALTIVSVRAYRSPYRPDPRADVVLASVVVPPAMPLSGPKLVLMSDEDSWPRNASVRAVLGMGALPGEVVAAVTASHAGLYALSAEHFRAFPTAASGPRIDNATLEEHLTAREIDVLRMLADGGSNKQIGGALQISSHTAKFHVAQILAKLRVHSRATAVRVGIRRGLVIL